MAEDNIITVEELTQAIRMSPNYRDLPEEKAYAIARHVLNFFGYSDRIIDNVLEPEDRDAFYMLEDATILTTEREETTLYDGREWRINYWLFRKDRIYQIMKDANEKDTRPEEERFYDEIPEDAWNRNAS